jgi:hypothetical protein
MTRRTGLAGALYYRTSNLRMLSRLGRCPIVVGGKRLGRRAVIPGYLATSGDSPSCPRQSGERVSYAHCAFSVTIAAGNCVRAAAGGRAERSGTIHRTARCCADRIQGRMWRDSCFDRSRLDFVDRGKACGRLVST